MHGNTEKIESILHAYILGVSPGFACFGFFDVNDVVRSDSNHSSVVLFKQKTKHPKEDNQEGI